MDLGYSHVWLFEAELAIILLFASVSLVMLTRPQFLANDESTDGCQDDFARFLQGYGTGSYGTIRRVMQKSVTYGGVAALKERTVVKVLLAEDDEYLLSALLLALQHHGYSVNAVKSGPEAQSALLMASYDICLLDLGLPGIDGLQILAGLKARGVEMPVIVITARDGLDDKIEGLDLGASDYLVKPFHFKELEARMRASLRKSQWRNRIEIEFGSLRLNTNSGAVTLDDELVELTKKEAVILKALMSRAGAVVSKRQLMEQASDWTDESSENAVEIVIHRLRRKLAASNIMISTMRGFGYKLETKGSDETVN